MQIEITTTKKKITKKLKHITHWMPLPKPPKVTNK